MAKHICECGNEHEVDEEKEEEESCGSAYCNGDDHSTCHW